MISPDVVLGRDVVIHNPQLVNLYGCVIGDGSRIGTFVEIRRTVTLGRHVKVQAFVFIPEGVTVGDNCFIGPHVCFTNDKYPRASREDGRLLGPEDWEVVPTVMHEGASIGANSTIICGITIGRHSLVGAGAVVTKDVPDYAIVTGVPAVVVGDVRETRSA